MKSAQCKNFAEQNTNVRRKVLLVTLSFLHLYIYIYIYDEKKKGVAMPR